MKQIRSFFLLLVAILFAIGCKKEHVPSNVTSSPVFYFNGMVNGVSTSLNAGVNNYYMYSSYIQDSNHVYNFIGNLKETNSNLNSIEIIINDYKVSTVSGSTQIDSSLYIGAFPYYTGSLSTNSYKVQFNSSYSNSNGSPVSYHWDFGDGNISTLQNPLHTYTQLNKYSVCLNVTGSNGCSNSTCDTVNLSTPTAYACHTTISASVSGDTVSFSNTSSGVGSLTYFWNFNDPSNTSSSDSSFSQSPIYTYQQPGIYHPSLTVTDSSGNVATAKYNLATDSYSISTCQTNFSVVSTQSVIAVNNLGLGKVIVKWTDASGTVYTSNNSLQPSNSSFQIISVENYQNNINNQTTKKLHIKFSCRVYNGSNYKTITNADAVIAVAYK